MDKPRILWIDDVYGNAQNFRNRDREVLCSRLGLQDITGDCLSQEESEPKSEALLVIDDREKNGPVNKEKHDDEVIADVIFWRGQVETSDNVRNDLEGTLKVVREGWEHPPRWSLLLLDMHFATGTIGADGELMGKDEDWDPEKYFGLTILESLWRNPELREIPVVITSAMEREVIEHRFAKQGVWAFVDKDDLNKSKLKELLEKNGLLADDKIVGYSLPLLKCLREARRWARIPTENVLILGERSTGKELLAEYIHQQSGREGDYVSFSQYSEETLADELSDAAVLANEGTLFIDKFGDIIATAQPKLPQLLEDIRNSSLQVVMAIEPEEILSEENFLKALPDKVEIHIPTLSQRSEDIPLLVEYFVEKYEKEFNAKSREVSEEALEALKAYTWPFNVRALESVIKEAVYEYKDIGLLAKNHLNLPSHETHIPPVPSNQPNSFDLFKIIVKDDLWDQFREVIGEMAIWLQDMAIWVLTEKALRGAIATIMSGEFGIDWLDNVGKKHPDLQKEVFENWQNRQEDYSEKDFPGEKSDLPDLINFATPSNLFKIILHRELWDHFRKFFGTDAKYDNHWFEHWKVKERSIVHRVRNLMNHSNPDLIPSHDHNTFKGSCGEILEICQKIETELSERSQQLESELPLPNAMDRDQEGIGEEEELYEGKILSVMDNKFAIVEINEHRILPFAQVLKCDFQSEDAFAPGKKVKFKVEEIEQDFRVYDVFLAESE